MRVSQWKDRGLTVNTSEYPISCYSHLRAPFRARVKPALEYLGSSPPAYLSARADAAPTTAATTHLQSPGMELLPPGFAFWPWKALGA